MADNRNFAALDWLIHEIGETLKEARQSLEAFVENPKDTARIRFCLTHIHQVHGSLQMVEFYGAAMLAEEMEKLTQAMINNTVANPAEAQEVLMRAILQFPVYLDQVKATRRDNPLVVLPLLNDLRAVRGESLLTDTKLFVPNLAPAKRISGMRLPVTQDNQQFQEMVKKLRQMYQYAAAGFIRGVNPDENLGYLQKVFSRLHKLTQGTARAPLWDICLALAEALQIDAIEISVSIKNLLRQLDKEIKVLAVHGVKALDAFTQDELIKNLLYYVARSGKHAPGFPPNSHLQRIYQGYQLEAALVEGKEVGDDAQNMLSAPDPEAMRSVVEALKGELDVIKHALDICLSGGDTRSALSDALPVVKRVADTMAVLGIGELRKQVLEQGAVLEMVVDANSQLSNDQLMSVAGKVIEIEDALDHLASQSSQANRSGEEADITLNRAKESVLRESRNGLEHAKDAIIEYIASQWDRAHLQAVPETLREIRGGLEIMPLPRPARILGACARYIEEQLLQQDEVPQWNNLDTLADAITSVEYYLERLSSGARKEENDLLLSVAEESVASLGYAVAKMPRPEPKPFDAEDDHISVIDTGEIPSALADAAPDTGSPDITQESDEDTAALLAAYQAALEPDADTNSTSVMTEEPAAELEPEDITANEWTLPEEDQAEEDQAESAPIPETVAEQEPAAEEFINYSSTAENIADDEDDDLDDEIIDIFVEEAGEVTQTIGEYFPQWAQNFDDAESLTEFRRAFHTLKGSGRMVGANDIGELAWSIENMLNRIIDGTVTPSQPHIAIIEKVRLLLPGMINAFSLHQPNPEPELTAAYRAQAEALAKGIVPPELSDAPAAAETGHDADMSEAMDVESDDAEITLETIAAELEPENGELPQAEEITYASFIDATTDEDNAEHHMDDEEVIDYDSLSSPGINALDGYLIEEDSSEVDDPLWDIFGAEALSHLEVVQNYIQRMEEQAPFYDPPSEHMQRALHTLKGSAHMAEITPVAELATPLEKFVKELRSYQVNINDDILQLLRDAVSYTHIALDNIHHNEPIEIPRLQQFLARVHELREIHVAPLARQQEADANGKRPIDPELLSIFMAEEMNLLLNADQIIEHWREAPNDLQQLNPLINELRNLTHGAAHAYLPPMATLGEKLQAVYQRITSGQLNCSDDVCATLNAAHLSLLDMVDAVAAGQNLGEIPPHINESLDNLINPAPSPLLFDPTESDVEAEAEAEEDVVFSFDVQEESAQDEDFDPEIVEIFIEEASELLEDIERALHEWQEDWNNTEPVEDLKRSLHTFKGGARLAGMMDIGDLSHEFESVLIEMGADAQIDQSFFKKLNNYQDRLHLLVDRARAKLAGEALPPLEEGVLAAPESHVVDELAPMQPMHSNETDDDLSTKPTFPSESHEFVDTSKVIPFTPKPKQVPSAPSVPSVDMPGMRPGPSGGAAPAPIQHLATRRSGPQEVVKVSAELLEELVNLAGETSISRGRMEQQVSDLSTAIDEMDSTIQRLQEQLRRLDIETEAQVLFRQEQMSAHEEFDPLEMDRYSQLQQLSRSLIESASDLMDLKFTLADKTRDTETLLLQQSRINTDLQEGLMRSRMVPFSRLVPRLRRIVRQAATELGKEVEFELDNVEGELDRTVLERMVAPLEHMLRNAVDHGIESTEDRINAGKPAAGRIVLSLGREGGDVMLRLADDGRGINLKRVREKAIERGLMAEGAQLSDQDIIQFILHAGFSTADKVTQISGRGVGMDVVHSEIKQLGGAMFIDSTWGQGTEFIVRLPFTVSVNRALMVQIGDDLYAIPLNTIEGIVRVSPFELEHYYQDEQARFEYAGENYLVRYLGTMLDSMAQPKLDGQSLPLPVVLVRSAENTVALQVDRLLGSREIVVKTLGVQFSTVRGVSGATVMGDGSVVVILDLHALIREQLALGLGKSLLLEPLSAAPAKKEDQAEQTVMVVDDSVTVRKVTSRFLEREGFIVITAKDGAEALLLLQDHIPDVMLLDIEMPRMDGFEVAKNIRTSSRLKDIPIIMITSRTGDKHRERAFSLGVNKYMGKPYQEDLLLNNINELLGKPAR